MNRTRTMLAVIATMLLVTAAPLVLAQEKLSTPHKPLPVVTVTLAHAHFTTQVATTDESRAYGLMGRTTMPADSAMLFVFRHTAPRWFWMKDTKIPLDILFFDAQHKLVAMQLDALPCSADPCKVYPSEKPAQYVLELTAGTVQRLGVHEGARLYVQGRYGNVQ
jgi:uncharacterized membrane protein (UPF0127 family)